ncbi:MAG: photosynthetic complex assembly protein [Sulfitobacter sp.]|nr:photosynthetic complex assembly protein [Sulfitobacter sp.]
MTHNTSPLAHQMKARDREMVPRVLVVAMFGLMLASLVLVSFARLTDQPLRGVPAVSEVVREMPITLLGSNSDGVAVLDASGQQIAHSDQKRAGFIGVIWSSVIRQRQRYGITENTPLQLQRFANGHTAILDPATGWSIELIGYGADNVAAFATLID